MDDLEMTAVFFTQEVFGFGVGSVARDGVDPRLYCGHERVVGLEMVKVRGERDDVVGIFREFLTTKLLSFNWPPLSLGDPRAFVAFHGDDQNIPYRLGFLQKINVFAVEEVEEAGGQD